MPESKGWRSERGDYCDGGRCHAIEMRFIEAEGARYEAEKQLEGCLATSIGRIFDPNGRIAARVCRRLGR